MLQKLPVNNFEWIKDTFSFNEDFIKNFSFKKDIFLKLMFNILQNYMSFIVIYHFYQKENSVANLTEYVIHIRNLKQELNSGLVFLKVNINENENEIFKKI